MATIKTESRPTNHQTNAFLKKDDVKLILERKLHKKNFQIINWNLDSRGKINGYLGQYYTLNVTVRNDGAIRTLKFFVKTPPPRDSPQYDFLFRFDTFNKEVTVYTEIIERIGTGRGLKWHVDCYLSKRDLVMVLEDATVEGYATPDKYIPFDESQYIWLLKALARLHSRSLILDNLLGREGRGIREVYGHLLHEVLFKEDDKVSSNALHAGIKGSQTIIDLADELTLEEKPRLKDRVEVWCLSMPRLLKASTKYRNVMCHRDVWANNIMFKKDQSGNPIGCYILDFQFLHYCPPAFDFAFSLFASTSKALRDKKGYEYFARIYHDSLKEGLEEEKLDVGDDLSWDVFWESCEFARQVGIVYAILNLQIQLLSGDIVETYLDGPTEDWERVLYSDERKGLVRQQYQTVRPYRQRLTEIVFEIRDNLPDKPPDV